VKGKNGMAKIKKYASKRIAELADPYVKDLLWFSDKPITPETIELKRQQVTMKRTLKQFKQWRKDRESSNPDV
jgi:hypothetical protein